MRCFGLKAHCVYGQELAYGGFIYGISLFSCPEFHALLHALFLLHVGSSLWRSLLGLSLTRLISVTNKLNGENIDTIWYFISEIIAWRVSALSSSRAFFSGLSSCCFFSFLESYIQYCTTTNNILRFLYLNSVIASFNVMPKSSFGLWQVLNW